LLVKSEGVSQAPIDLKEVVLRSVDNVIGGFAEQPDMWSETIFEPPAEIAEYLLILRKVPSGLNPLYPSIRPPTPAIAYGARCTFGQQRSSG